MTRVAIVVLNWNCAEDTIKCVHSLLMQKKVTPDIIVVDNASSDNSVSVLEKYIKKQKSKSIHFMKNAINSGYTGGNNLGFQYAIEKAYDYVGTLNPDASAESTWVYFLTKELIKDNTLGITTGILARNNYETIDSTGDFYTTWGIPSPRGRDTLLKDAPKKTEFIFGSTGGGFIARANALKKVGLLDEKFFMYFEDVDLSFRIQLAGWKVRYVPSAVAYHKISASTKKVPGLAVRMTFQNLPLLFTKNVPFSLWKTILPRFWLAYNLIFLNAILHGNGIPAVKGRLSGWSKLPHAFRERRRIQSQRKVSDEYIDSIILHDIPTEQTGLRKFRKIFTGKS